MQEYTLLDHPQASLSSTDRDVSSHNRDNVATSMFHTDTKVISNVEKKRFAQQSPSEFQSPFNLATLNGINGFVVNGISSGNYLGTSVSTAGDVNGDGKTDLVLGAYGVSSNAGAVYVIFGQSSFPSLFNVTTLNGINGFVVKGISSGDSLGYSVSTAGDINGDGKTDLVLGAQRVSNNAGSAYIIFGQSSFPPAFNLTTLNGANGFVVNGISNGDALGNPVSTAGDINEDGKTDLVLGAQGVSNNAGSAYVIFGQSSFPSPFNLTTLNGTNGFVVDGISSGDSLGYSVSTAGDINGDGKTDLVLGARGVSNFTGAAYVVFGQSSFPSSFNLTTLNGANGFVVNGISSGDYLGTSVNTAGDINEDGKTDLVLGADRVSSNAGAVYVIFGQSSFPPAFNLTTLNGANGFVVNGISSGDYLGISASTAGDINGDGKTGLVLGAGGVSNFTGAAYVIFGQPSFPSSFNLTTLNGSNGFVVDGISRGDNLGYSVSTAGNITGDGKTDLMVGAFGAPNGTNNGAVYVIFGKNTTFITPIPIPTPIPMSMPIPMPTSIPMPMPIPQMNQPPVVTHPIPDQSIEVGAPFNFTIALDTFTDPNGDSLTYSAHQVDGNSLPSWLAFDAKNRFFSGITSLAGATPLSVQATDTVNLSTSSNFSLLATEPATPATPSSSVAAIAGGVVGGILGFGALIGLGYGLYKKCGLFSGHQDQSEKTSDTRATPLTTMDKGQPREKSGKRGMSSPHTIDNVDKTPKPF